MKSRTTTKFRKAFANLPDSVQKQARQAYRQFQQDSSHPSLRFKQVHPLLCQFTRLVSAKAIEQSVSAMMILWFGFGSVLTQNTTNFYHKFSCGYNPAQERTD